MFVLSFRHLCEGITFDPGAQRKTPLSGLSLAYLLCVNVQPSIHSLVFVDVCLPMLRALRAVICWRELQSIEMRVVSREKSPLQLETRTRDLLL